MNPRDLDVVSLTGTEYDELQDALALARQEADGLREVHKVVYAEIEAERDKARQEAEANRLDAERYRQLRKAGAAIDPDSLHWRRGKWLDLGVDAAKAGEK